MKIEFSLLDNAIDSIWRAIELLAWKDEANDAKRLKQAILAVSHGVELLLKERLRRVHPILVWENVDKFPALNARTVTVDLALSRLIKIGGLSFPESDSELLKSLRSTRNAIEHYVWATTKAEADRIVGQALGFALHFAKDELQRDLIGYESRKDDTLGMLLGSNPQFAKAFRERYESRAEHLGEDVLPCDFCHALATNPLTGACKLCGHWNDVSNEIPY